MVTKLSLAESGLAVCNPVRATAGLALHVTKPETIQVRRAHGARLAKRGDAGFSGTACQCCCRSSCSGSSSFSSSMTSSASTAAISSACVSFESWPSRRSWLNVSR